MNAEQLGERIAQLEQARAHWQEQVRIAQANMNAAEGALSECRYWLEKEQESEGDDGPVEAA